MIYYAADSGRAGIELLSSCYGPQSLDLLQLRSIATDGINQDVDCP